MVLMPPTVRTLDDLARFPSSTRSSPTPRGGSSARSRRSWCRRPTTSISYPDNTGNAALPSRRLVARSRPLAADG